MSDQYYCQHELDERVEEAKHEQRKVDAALVRSGFIDLSIDWPVTESMRILNQHLENIAQAIEKGED